MPDLKPCPFCGREPTIDDIEPHEHHLRLNGVKLPDYPGSTVIECGCGCGLIDESRETVIERWNTRADSAAVAAERDEMNDFFVTALKLALDAECLWLDCTDNVVVSKWMDPLYEAITRTKECAERLDRAAEKGGTR